MRQVACGEGRFVPRPVSGASILCMHYVCNSRYDSGMASLLQIRDVPEETRRELKARAAARGQSMNAYLVDLVNREVERPTVAEVLHRAERRAERAGVSAAEFVAAARVEREERVHGQDHG